MHLNRISRLFLPFESSLTRHASAYVGLSSVAAEDLLLNLTATFSHKRMKYVEGKRNICVCCVFSANNIYVYITIPPSYNHFLSRQHRALPHCVPDHTRSTVFSFFSPPSCLSPSRVTSPTVRSFSPL